MKIKKHYNIIENGLKHLEDQKIYIKLQKDPTLAIASAIKDSVNKLYEAGYINEHTLAYLTPPYNVRTQQIYFYKKIHINPHGIRPNVPRPNGKKYQPS